MSSITVHILGLRDFAEI